MVSKPRLVQGEVDGQDLLRTAESQEAAIDPIAKGGRIVRNVALGTTPKKVPHGLKVKPQGWIPIRVQASASPGYPYETEPPTNTHLTLAMGADAKVDLKVW